MGHTVQDGNLLTMESNVEKIRDLQPPVTKKQLRSLLGLTGYYRKFIPNYAEKALPLTELSIAKAPDELVWNEKHQIALDQFKGRTMQGPYFETTKS